MPAKKKASTPSKTATKPVAPKTTPGKQRIRIKIKAFDHKVIDDTTKLIIETAERSGAMICGPIPLPTKIEKFTVNRSTFVHKTSREQFEMRTHKRLIDITDSTPKTIEMLSNLSLPAGVDIEIKMITD
ncbi:MAG: 30S ribosomal protein S10 [Candidatus Gracilibacteria bacterium]|jgi:small subunit ribosomal protein S10